MLTFDSINDALCGLSKEIKTKGILYENNGNITGSETLKYPGVAIFAITNPCRRILLCEKRRNNPFAQLFETFWVLSGGRDVGLLSHFIPSARKWADNGEEWRASYGSRLRYSIGLQEKDYNYYYRACREARIEHMHILKSSIPTRVDQIEYVIEELAKDKHSRRAVMTLWEPTRDCKVSGSKDYPCTNYINFWIESGKLNCKVSMRSNDLIFGFSHINMYEYSYLQELIACKLGVRVGTYYHDVVNLHVYKKDLARLEKICESEYIDVELPTLPALDLLSIRRAEKCLGLIESCVESEDFAYRLLLGEVEEQVKYIILYLLYKKRGKEEGWFRLCQSALSKFSLTDMKLAAYYWFAKREDKNLTLKTAYDELKEW